jgi:transcriptional regulator with XRE-family HTH domain
MSRRRWPRDAALDLAFARAMRELRTEADSTMAEVARDTGVCHLTVSNYHRRAPDSLHGIVAILGYYGECLGDFFIRVSRHYYEE